MAASRSSTIVLAVGGRLARSDFPALCERVRILLETSDARIVLCDVGALEDVDVVAVDALAHIQLTALRLGRRVRLCRPSDELRQLLGLTGLAHACGLALEREREAEEREQGLGVEEEGELDDAPA